MLINIAKYPKTFPLSPSDLGMPGKLAQWRDSQAQALHLITESMDDSSVECVGLNLPTGSGKSAVYVASALMFGRRAIMLTHTKALQAQLLDDFAPTGLADVRGRSNYLCESYVDTNCEDGSLLGCRRAKGDGCPYRKALRTANTSNLCSTNYALYMALDRYTEDPLTRAELLVMDEAHDAGDYLCSALSFQISEQDIAKRLNVQVPSPRVTIKHWQLWAAKILPAAQLLLKDQRERVLAAPSTSNIRELGKFSRLVKNMEGMEGLLGQWTVEEGTYLNDYGRYRFWAFDLVHPTPYRDTLLQDSGALLAVSGTLTPYTIERLGFGTKECWIAEFPSPFDRLRSPFYVWPVVNLTHKSNEEDKEKWVEAMDAIMSSRADRKGIIHTTSYERAVYLRYKSRHSDRMILHESGSAQTMAAIAKHRESLSPTVLVSPSLTTGYDFAYDACEWQIIAKMPFPDTRSALMRARCGGTGNDRTPDQETYSSYIVANVIVQMDGRGTRAMDDRCETFIVDGNFSWFYRRNSKHFPAYFRSRVKWIDKLPTRPPKLNRPKPLIPEAAIADAYSDDIPF